MNVIRIYKESEDGLERFDLQNEIEFIELAKLGQQMRWVKCSERLPDLDGHYLVCNNVGREISYFFKRYGCFISNNITHWLPLPPNPKGEE